MADITVGEVKERFPNFANKTDPQITYAIQEAYALTDVSSLITMYAIAHVLQLDEDIANDVDRLGETTETKVGPITTKHKSQAMTERQTYFTRTEYGRRVLSLESRNVGAVASVKIG